MRKRIYQEKTKSRVRERIIKIVSIVGARPQFVKIKPIIEAINKRNFIRHILVHTGQHYDHNMSKIFFDEFTIPRPNYNLGVGSHPHGRQTALMLDKIEKILSNERPDIILVYGDTNSTLAGALAAAKLNIPIAHVEAGLRSFRSDMPEEVNRIVVDRISSLLFCPTKTACNNLRKEGIKAGIHLVGDVMFDVFISYAKYKNSDILQRLNIKPKQYLLLTVHRQENMQNLESLKIILSSLSKAHERVVFPMHPRTSIILKKLKRSKRMFKNILFIKPVSYRDMITLEKNSKIILTDSGGVQKEAYFLKVPCITLRRETEWPETLSNGWNRLSGINGNNISRFVKNNNAPFEQKRYFGTGNSADKIIRIIKKVVVN
jgi:UDP-N-acetylglucosamine 2-epimerase